MKLLLLCIGGASFLIQSPASKPTQFADLLASEPRKAHDILNALWTCPRLLFLLLYCYRYLKLARIPHDGHAAC